MIIALAATIAAGIALPHALRLQRVAPAAAIVLWLSSLALRAFGCALAVVYALFYLPRTNVFDVLTHWCWHSFLPVAAGGHGVDGHSVGDLAVLVPALLLALSLAWVSIETVRATRLARRLVKRHALDDGPRGSLIVGGPDVTFAVAGIARPRILVSAGALTSLDDDELAAALDHEQAHIARHHRFLMLLATGFHATGRPIPGGGRALRELAFHLERDADHWALRHRPDRLALASVIAKAASTQPSGGNVAVAGIGQSGVRQRVLQLLEEESGRKRRPAAAALNALAATMVACALLLAVIVPAAAVAGVENDAHVGHHGHHCEH
jgi:Peptidase family M48